MLKNMFSVAILAGGLATRLHPVTMTIPKSLIPINQEPFIAHQLRLLRKNNIRHVVICTGFLGEQIEAFIGNGKIFDLKVTYVNDGPTLLGTAGALKQALPYLSDSFFVLYGDSYLPCNYAKIQNHFTDSDKLGLMTVFHNENQWDNSNVEFNNHQIIKYDKIDRTPNMSHIDYGLGIFNKMAFDYVPANVNVDLAELYQKLLTLRELAAIEIPERFYETGSFSGIKALEHYLRSFQEN